MPGRYTSARFIGRDDAFARLAAVLEDAASGRARTMLVSGPAGVGITRFLDESMARVAALEEPMTVLRARAMPAGTDEPYGPVVRALGPLLETLPRADLDAGLARRRLAWAAYVAFGRHPGVERRLTRFRPKSTIP